MRHADLLGQWTDAGECFRVSMVQIDLSDELIDLIGEDVLAAFLGIGETCVAIPSTLRVESGRTFDTGLFDKMRIPSRTISPRRKRTSLMPCGSLGLPPFRMSSITNTRTCGSVRKASRAHFSTKCGGAITKPVNGMPALCTSMVPSAMSVFPAPHSATTLALRANCHRLLTPMIAMVCAG
jgi:hypothetical protein